MAKAILSSEVVAVFREELRAGQRKCVPTETQAASLVSLLNLERSPGCLPLLLSLERLGPVVAALEELSDGGYRSQQGLRQLKQLCPGRCEEVPEFEALQAALDALGDFLQPKVSRKQHAGRPPLRGQSLAAYMVAYQIGKTLQVAGLPGRISLARSDGPVARIGAKLMARWIGRRRIEPATYATWVENGWKLAAAKFGRVPLITGGFIPVQKYLEPSQPGQ